MGILETISSRSIPSIPDAKLFLGQGQLPLEVILINSLNKPTVASIRETWKKRQSGRPTPILLVYIYDAHSTICGPSGDLPPILNDVELRQVEKLCLTALQEPDRHSALRFLRKTLEAIDSHMAGIKNEGFLSTHEIEIWLKEKGDLPELRLKSQKVVDEKGNLIFDALGFETSKLSGPASILVSKSKKLALAIFIDRDESPESPNSRFYNSSPVTYGLTKADQENLKYLIITDGTAIRIYPTQPGVGVGRRGRTETFIELHLDLLREEYYPLIWYIFSSEALEDKGYLDDLLDNSKRYSTSLGDRLRDRVYQNVIPQLSKALVQARDLQSPTQQDLDSTYHMALTLLFRILFIAYGEDKDLLPYRTNDLYRARSFKQKATDLLKIREESTGFDAHSYSHWDDAVRLFDAVNKGSVELGVPLYSGGLFSDNSDISTTGAILSNVRLTNSDFGPVLTGILLDESVEGIGPVDFRSLGVREFGTIYEGLLESELSVAETDLIVDTKGNYKPANKENEKALEVHIGEVYIHNKSGARKSTGSYFTKSFAVDHLLDHSLEPALDDHVARLEALDDFEAGNSFFDIRVADISMGSGHFLVAAVDRIEIRLQQYLSSRPLTVVIDELARLRTSATKSLGSLAVGIDIEDTTLLRRQIARRCIYGVDINPIAVELARVSLWIHTFVPGLPLSMLDHHLVEGNSLVGIGTLDEARELVSEASGGPLFNVFVENLISTAAKNMAKVGDLSDADAAEIQAAQDALAQARESLGSLQAMFDILAASRMDGDVAGEIISNISNWQDNPETIKRSSLHKNAVAIMAGLQPFHFPVTFPDVLARSRAGFDVILGNPPWKEVVHKEDSFWSRFFPGFSSRPQWEREKLRSERPDLYRLFQKEKTENALIRSALVTGPYPGIGLADPDMYKAFAWRFWHLISKGGHIGVVLPRSIWNGESSVEIRKAILKSGNVRDITFLVNYREWVFKSVGPKYTIALSSVQKTDRDEGLIHFRGPYSSMASFSSSVTDTPIIATTREIRSWTDSAMIPLLKNSAAMDIFRKMKNSPSLTSQLPQSFRVLPHRELDATNDKNLMTFTEDPPQGYWPVFGGKSFDIWQSDRGYTKYYAWVDPNTIVEHLENKRLRASNNKRSPFAKFAKEVIHDLDTLPCKNPRIVTRLISRATDSRTIICALAPPNIALQNGAPYLLFVDGTPRDEAYVLGVLSSLPLDWFARTLVEINVNHHFFHALPVPRVSNEHSLIHRVIALSGRLASPDERFADWAKEVGVQYGPVEPDEKQDMINELDAAVAHLYGLSESQLRHIFETFHVGWDYEDRLVSTLDHYRRLEVKI